MSSSQLITIATEVVFGLVFLLVLRRALLRPNRVTVDTALFFGVAALVLNAGWILSLLSVSLNRFGAAAVIALLLGIPYLFLRLLDDFTRVSTWLMRAAEAGLALFVVLILVLSGPLPLWMTLYLIVYFAGLEIYAGLRFGRLAVRLGGINQQRMVAVAVGSGLLGFGVAVAGVGAVFPKLTAVVGSLTELFALVAGLAYFAGFSPPRWLRRVWQEQLIRSFVLSAAATSGSDDLDDTLSVLERNASLAVGGSLGAIGLWNPAEASFVFHTRPAIVPVEDSLSGRLFKAQKAQLTSRRDFPKGTVPLILDSDARGAAAFLGAPLTVGDQRLGVLLIAAERMPHFADDDLSLVELLSTQAAMAVAAVRRNQALRRQADLLELAHDAILVRAMTAGAITFWNRGAQEVYGWTATEALGRVSHELLNTHFPRPLSEILNEVARAGSWEGELEQRTKGGARLVVSSRWALQRDQQGKALGVLEINTDITARKQAERELLASNVQLADANKHKSQFLANMSHELRTPLNAILGFSQLLGDDATGHYDAATRSRFLAQIHSGGLHLLGLINDILDLSKVDAGQMVMTLTQTSAANNIQGVLATVEPLARAKEITLSTQTDPGLDLIADAGKLKQILLNLVSNAIKFTPKGGNVTIASGLVGPWVEFSVTDTGIGIAEADLGRLFTEFQQLDSGPNRQQEGTGLGLALTKRFAELHGGDVRVESQPGKGSTFIVRLPKDGVQSAKLVPQAPPITLPPDPSRPLVLTVEDNPEAAEILTRHLDAGGFRTEVAYSGPEALALARDLKPVAITLDILLPGIDGWEVLAQLKASDSTRDIPVVIVSVVDNPSLGKALGAIDYFVKPVDGGALLSRLGQYTFTHKAKQGEIRVLVIDDEAANLDLLEALLEPEGFRVLRADGGKEGIERARSQLPHLILLDLMMPDVTGFDVVEALRSDQTTKEIPIMVLTAKELTAEDKRILNGHVAGAFERKSVAGADLVEWLRGLVSLRKPAEPRA